MSREQYPELELPEDSEDLLSDPSKFGFPTFEEFARDPERYLGREDEVLALADEGCSILRKSNLVRKHVYEIEGFKCKSLEEVQKVAKSQGIPLTELDYSPVIIPRGAGQCDVLVKFIPKAELNRRSKEDRANAIEGFRQNRR